MTIKTSLIKIFSIPLLFFSCKTEKIANSSENLVPLPAHFRHEQPTTQQNSSIGSIPWKTFFKNPVLQTLIDSAILYNADMQLALKNIESSKLLVKQAKMDFFPTIQAQITANSTNPSNNSLNGVSLSEFLKQNHIEDYTASVGLSWEVDVWGKIRNKNKAVLAEYLQSEEAKKLIQTQLISQIAKGYYQLLLLYDLQHIAQQNLNLSAKTLTMVEEQYEVGDMTLLALEQVHAQKLAAEVLIPEFQQQIHLQETAIQILSGHLPDEIQTTENLVDIQLPEEYFSGVPADLLARRPDVKAAELAVTAADAYQKSAKAQMYPSLVISAEAGVNALKASNWFTLPASLFGAVAGSITQPILQRRALKTQYELAQIEQEKSVIIFKQSLISAVGEVSDALISIQKLKQKHDITKQRTQRLRNATQHADLLFETGSASYLEVITAQSNVLQTELQLAQIKKDELAAVVDLYRSLGGGWQER